MARVKSVRKVIGLIVAGLILAGLVFHTALNIYAEKKIGEEIRKVEEREEPTSLEDLATPSVPDEQNAVDVRQDDSQTDDPFIQLVDKQLGTDWYGIYTLGNKVGYAILTVSRDKVRTGST